MIIRLLSILLGAASRFQSPPERFASAQLARELGELGRHR